ncbi:sugar phosphorylase [Pontibacter sp. JAM-7]|uniref:sugar phosphorylase n=1 Tax=Pontibacter sp. JAM-7 TaxID=3366581 RepID=UPI003AF52441
MTTACEQLRFQLATHLQVIYAGLLDTEQITPLADELVELMRLQGVTNEPRPAENHWDQQDVVLISYGDTLLAPDEWPLHTLLRFMDEYSEGLINSLHILPFFPFSSDDGFAVQDFFAVRDSLGDWQDIRDIASHYRLMADLVINHGSSDSEWFRNFLQNKSPGRDFYFTAEPEADLSAVVRPRTTPLLNEVEAVDGKRHVWCTFSPDQVDFNFRNPELLKMMVRIVRFYLDQGVKIFRLDAVAFLWKEIGGSCLNLEQTHEVVRLLRSLIEYACDDAVIITETNIPSRENLSYFGNGNEAHCVYNFSLPPLLVYTLISGDSHYLKQWLMAMPPAQDGTAFFNFIASHDGIGLRPLENLLTDAEEQKLVETMQQFGGEISWRSLNQGESRPYEINISLFDALQGTQDGPDSYNEDRFICAHAIMLALEGIPAIYIQSLFGSHNDYARMARTGHNRSINRSQWQYQQLQEQLDDPHCHHHRVLQRLKHLLRIRTRQPAFHPNATQFTLHLGSQLFGFWRQSPNRRQSIFCIANISNQQAELRLSDLNLVNTQCWQDLLTRAEYSDLHAVIDVEPYQVMWISNRSDS